MRMKLSDLTESERDATVLHDMIFNAIGRCAILSIDALELTRNALDMDPSVTDPDELPVYKEFREWIGKNIEKRKSKRP